MARPEKNEQWVTDAAELMARTGLSFKEAVAELNEPVTTDVCDAVVRRKSFNRLLWECRHRYFTQLAQDPAFNQDVVVGKLLSQAQKLEDKGFEDKAAEVLLKIAKIRGWVGPDSQISVFGELSQSDLDSIRKKLEGESAKARPN